VKLIYDGDRSQRQWWVERFGKEPEIECPNCKEWVGLTDEDLSVWPPPKRELVGLTDEEIFELGDKHGWYDDFGRWTFNGAGLIKFALALMQAEREACAKVCDQQYFAYACVEAIRARGEE
jgi:hypothetical protein